ncbi:MAG: MFS transporter [Chloroflexi bacterium]|nr:MFS transporter [Chloroflexota bacterium]
MPTPKDPWQRTLAVLFVAQLLTAAGFASIFPFLPLYVEALGSTTGLSVEVASGLVFSASAAAMMIASPIWGSLSDRYGRKVMIQRAAFSGALLLGGMGFVRSAEQLILVRIVQGFLTGVVSANSALLASVTPRHRSGYAMGMLQVALGAGLAAGPLVGGAIADSFGYRPAFYVTGVLLFIAGLLVTFLVREDFIPPETPVGARAVVRGWRQVLAQPGVSVTYLMRFISQMGRMMVVPIAPFFIQSLSTDAARLNTYVGLALGLSAGATTLSAGYLGRLGDGIGHRKVLIACTLLGGLLFLPQGQVGAVWQLLALIALAGVAMGGVIPSISALLANYTHPGQEGAAYGLDNSINAAGGAVAPLLGGAVAAWFGLPAAFTATGILLLAASGIAALRLPPARPAAAPELSTGD